MVLSWETLWKADKPKEGSAILTSRWIGTARKKTPNSLEKEKGG
jgi:hypothetical protein